MAEYRYNLRGEIDLATAPQVRADLAELASRDGANLVVDCSELTFIDSSGVAALLEVSQDMESHGRQMLIVNAPAAPHRVFELLGLTDLIRFDRDVS